MKIPLEPDCETTSVLPAIVMVPRRGAAVLFGAASQVRFAPPMPVIGLTVSHAESLFAIQDVPAGSERIAFPLL